MEPPTPITIDRTPLTVYLPFNIDAMHGEFVPAKQGVAPTANGYWLMIQEQGLVVLDQAEVSLPSGDLPAGFEDAVSEPLALGTWQGHTCWAVSLPREFKLPPGFRRETLIPMQGPGLPDDVLSLGGVAMQALYWASTSSFCPRCGGETKRIDGEWGKRCPGCGYEHYPHLHPAVIVLVRDGNRLLLTRKAIWAPGRYALIAGFVDNGESLEAAVKREVKEEVGVDVDDIRYVGSQNWPFPSQIMLGFVARYAGGEIRVDEQELEDARWFPCDELPSRPSRHSIAGFILSNYARCQDA